MQWHGKRAEPESLDLQIDTGDFVAAILLMAAGALAEFGEPDVAGLIQLESGGNQQAVDVEACLALKLEQHAHGAGIAGSAAKNPPATTEDGAGEGLHQSRRFFDRDGFHFQGPGNDCRALRIPLCPVGPHARYIGGQEAERDEWAGVALVWLSLEQGPRQLRAKSGQKAVPGSALFQSMLRQAIMA